MRKGKGVTKKVVLGISIVFVLIQFFRIDKTAPSTPINQDFFSIVSAPSQVESIIKRACYDCHSYKTVYPWYSNVAPVSWLLKKHINEGREHLNFSVWGTYSTKKKNHKLEECFEEVDEGEMPLTSYTLVHKEAKLTAQERSALVDWFKANVEMTDHGKNENEKKVQDHD